MRGEAVAICVWAYDDQSFSKQLCATSAPAGPSGTDLSQVEDSEGRLDAGDDLDLLPTALTVLINESIDKLDVGGGVDLWDDDAIQVG